MNKNNYAVVLLEIVINCRTTTKKKKNYQVVPQFQKSLNVVLQYTHILISDFFVALKKPDRAV